MIADWWLHTREKEVRFHLLCLCMLLIETQCCRSCSITPSRFEIKLIPETMLLDLPGNYSSVWNDLTWDERTNKHQIMASHAPETLFSYHLHIPYLLFCSGRSSGYYLFQLPLVAKSHSPTQSEGRLSPSVTVAAILELCAQAHPWVAKDSWGW